MANKLWTGATDGDFAVAGNWSPSGVPATTGDSLYFTSSPTNAVSSNLDRSASTFDAIKVGVNYDADIGTSAAPLICAATDVFMEGPGTFYLEAEDGAAGTDWIDNVFVTRGTLYMSAGASVSVDGPTALLRLIKGRVFLQNDGEFTAIEVLGGGGPNDAILDVDSSIDDNGRIATLTVRNGTVKCSSDITNLVQDGGDVELRDTAYVQTKATVRGGTLRLNSDFTGHGGGGGAIAAIDLYTGGTVLAEGNQKVGSPTITAATLYGGVYDMRTNGKGTVTTTTVNINGQNAQYLVDTNKKLTIADQ